MRQMTDDETRAFLMEGTRTGKIAWVGQDGRPHVAPIWFVLDGEDLVFNTHESSGKATALDREGRASLVVDDETPPFSFVIVDGTVTMDDDLDTVRRFATEIGGRYMGDDRAEEFGERNGVSGELLVRLTPTRVVARADVSD